MGHPESADLLPTEAALKLRAKQNGSSLATDVRGILNKAVLPADRIKIGTELRKLGKLLGGMS